LEYEGYVNAYNNQNKRKKKKRINWINM